MSIYIYDFVVLPLPQQYMPCPEPQQKITGRRRKDFFNRGYRDDSDGECDKIDTSVASETPLTNQSPGLSVTNTPEATTTKIVLSRDISHSSSDKNRSTNRQGRPIKINGDFLISEFERISALARSNGAEISAQEICSQLGISIRTFQRAKKRFSRQTSKVD